MTGPVIRLPSVGEEISQGLAPLLNALMQRQQLQQQQQQLDMQKQQAEQQRLAQESLERQRVSSRALQLMEAIGPDVLQDESVQQLLAQAGVDPKGILKQYEQRQKVAQQADDAFIAGLPPDIQPGLKLALGAVRSGVISKDDAFDFASQVNAGTIKPETDARILREFPEFAQLTPRERLKAYTEMQVGIAQARRGIGPEAKRQHDAQMAEARLEVARLRVELQQARGTPSKALQAAMALTRLVDQTVNDPTTIALANLVGKTRDEKVQALFGASTLTAYRNSLRLFEQTVNADVQPQP